MKSVAAILPTWIYQQLVLTWKKEGFKRYAESTAWAIFTRLFNTLTSFLVTIYLVRYLGPTNYGELSYAVSFVGVFSIIASLGLEHVLYRDLVKYPDKRELYLGTAFSIRLAAGLVAGIMTGVAGLIANPEDVSRLVILLLSATFVFTPFSIIIYEFQSNVAQKYPSLVTLIVVALLNVLKLVVIFSEQGVIFFAAILLLEPILYAIFFSYIRVRYYGSFASWKFDRTIASSLLKDSWPYIFISAFILLYTRIDQIMLKHLVDSTTVGIYDAALRLADAWLMIPSIIAASFFPAIVNGKSLGIKEYRTRLLSLSGVFVTLAIIVAIPLSIFASPIITLFYGTAFTESIVVFSIYIWTSVLIVVDIVTKQFLLIENMRKTIFFLTAGAAIANTGLNLILIPIFGAAGAAWATFFAYAILSFPIIMIYRLK